MTQAETQVDDELLNEELEVEEGQADAEAVEAGAEERTETTESEPDELEVRFEGESPPPEEEEEQRAPTWVRELRKSDREKAKRIRDLEAQLNAKAQPQAVVVGAKPTLEGAEYDTDRYERDLEQWHERKRTVEAETRKKQDEQANAQKEWQGKVDVYNSTKSEFKAKDFQDAEAEALSVLSEAQQAILLDALNKPVDMVYALGKSPKKLKELASIGNLVKFTAAVAKLEQTMTLSPRKAAPLPETAVKGSGRAVNNQTLERLESEADRTGDRSKVIAYKRQMKAKT